MTMVYFFVIILKTLKNEKTGRSNHFWLLEKHSRMARVYLCYEEVEKPEIVRFGTLMQVDASFSLASSTIQSVAFLSTRKPITLNIKSNFAICCKSVQL